MTQPPDTLYPHYPHDFAALTMAYDGEEDAFEVYHGDTHVATLTYPDTNMRSGHDDSILARIDCAKTTAYAETMLPYWSTRVDALDWITDQLDIWAQDEAEAYREELIEDNKPYNSYADYCNDAL